MEMEMERTSEADRKHLKKNARQIKLSGPGRSVQRTKEYLHELVIRMFKRLTRARLPDALRRELHARQIRTCARPLLDELAFEC